MSKEQSIEEMIDAEALAFEEMIQTRPGTETRLNAIGWYKAGRLKGIEREKELEDGLRKIKVHFGNGESRNPYIKPVIYIIEKLLNK